VQRLVLACATGVSDWYMGLPAALIRHRLGAAVSRGLFATGAPPEPVVRALAARPRGRAAALGIYNGRPAAQPQLIHPAMVMALISSACKPAAAPAAVALASHDLRERAHLISCPTLIVWGDRDNLVPLRCAHAYARLVPDSRLLVYEDTGHNPMIERPARFNADLSAFLDEDR
jgi:pimeloyl-ACP methyl ester carboxylesterase